VNADTAAAMVVMVMSVVPVRDSLVLVRRRAVS
jgi:hypothetical protein